MLVYSLFIQKLLERLLITLPVLLISASSGFAQETREEKPVEKMKYFGYTILFGSQSYELLSDRPKLHKLRVSREGGSVGAVLGNSKGAIRSTVGLFYSSATSPCTVDALEVGISGMTYLLRVTNNRYHDVEPYVCIAFKGIKSGFYGNFSETKVKKNNSVSEDEYAGAINSIQGFVGLGAEYQLQNDALQFIHFFAEARYGSTILNYSTSEVLSRTLTANAMSLVVGINFGKIKLR
jgi:hypothetical protein